MIKSGCKSICMDCSFIIEGQRQEELPEQVLGSIQLDRIDFDFATRLPDINEVPRLSLEDVCLPRESPATSTDGEGYETANEGDCSCSQVATFSAASSDIISLSRPCHGNTKALFSDADAWGVGVLVGPRGGSCTGTPQ